MNKKISRLLSLVLALMLCMAFAVPAMAKRTIEPSKSGKIQFDKILKADQYAVLPTSLEFEFTLTPVTANTVTGWTARTSDVNTDISVTAAASATDAVSSSVTTGNPNTMSIKVTYKTADKTTNAAAVELNKGFVIDFSGAVGTGAGKIFTQPGVYSYTLKEVAGSTNGVTYDSTTTYYIDVFVQTNEDTGELEIANIVVKKDSAPSYQVSDTDLDDTGKVNATPTNSTAASKATIENSWNTFDLTLEKKVTGNQGDRNKGFTFSVALTGLVPNATYYYKNASGTVTSFTADGSGTYTLSNVSLSNNGKIEVYDLPYNAGYTITETGADDYSTTTSGADTNITSAVTGGGTRQASGTITDENDDVIFTNNKEGTIPTGILLTIAPFAILILIGIAGVAFISMRKKYN